MSGDAVRLHGWGRTAASVARVRHVTGPDLAPVLGTAGPRGVLVRGLGRSYNDSAQNGGGLVVTLDGRHPLGLPDDEDVLEVPGGTSLDDLLRAVVAHGWFVPVTPGTRHVTVGGALAADVHGKNHHVSGSVAQHVTRMELLTADGELRLLDPSDELFWATAGGMGLTGVITRVWLRLIRVESAFMHVETRPAGTLTEVFDLLEIEADDLPYSVAWIDTMASGSRRGRGVVSLGRHAADHEVGTPLDPLRHAPSQRLHVPDVVPTNMLSNVAVRAFNELWWRRAAVRRSPAVESLSAFFHPLDGVGDWNRLYGPRGFVQHQMVVPATEREAVVAALDALTRHQHPSFLSVLKRLGPQNAGLLSFPMSGWTLAVDVPNRGRSTARLLDTLDLIALDAGGRVYLAKDGNVTPDRLARMYPRLDAWHRIRDEVDPRRVFQSDLGRRLQL